MNENALNDVQRIFPGARVREKTELSIIHLERRCEHCSEKNVPKWRRGGKIVPITEANGEPALMCHYCGRRVRQ